MTIGAKPKHGFLLGKFMPPHAGHKYLVDFARNYCEHLTILVASLPSEPIPGKLRYKWMKQMFPDCNVIWTDEILPQEPKDEDDVEFWEIWKQEIARAMALSYAMLDDSLASKWQYPDVVFASEEYGHKLAASVGARFVPVDIAREVCPISGTQIRNNPEMWWNYIPAVVRPYFQKRITLFGPESSGKTTLGRKLAAEVNGTFVPEYGRIYTEAFGSDVDQNDIANIVAGHQASVEAARLIGKQLIIEDTDPLMSMVWSDMLTGSHDPWFDSFDNYPDLYILCDIDIPWVDDGTRYFKDQEQRQMFFNLCVSTLEDRGVPYIIVSGNEYQRLSKAVFAIEDKFKISIW